jgi:hypothetical protein
VWQLKDRCLTTNYTLEMPIHKIVIHDQFEPDPIFISKSKHYTLSEPLIVVNELNVLLAHEQVHLRHLHFVLPEQEGRDLMVSKFNIHPPTHLKLLYVVLKVLVQHLP